MSTTLVIPYSGAPYDWIVPVGVTVVQATLKGGSTDNGAGPAVGGVVVCTFPVVAGDTLRLTAGSMPLAHEFVNPGGYGGAGIGGYNGGGNGAAGNGPGGFYGGGGGAGASDIRYGGTALSNRIAVAGGAGGETIGFYGGSGGAATGQAGSSPVTANGGGGGTQSAGGAGGGTPVVGTPGTLGQGGLGANNTVFHGPGGGGGGYYGGGGAGFTAGGANNGGGGGGSNFIAASYARGTITTVSNTQGGSIAGTDGSITLVYDAPPNLPVWLTPSPALQFPPFIADNNLKFKAQYVDLDGDGFASVQAQYRYGTTGGYTALGVSSVIGPSGGSSGVVSFTVNAGQITTFNSQVDLQIRFSDTGGSFSPWRSYQAGVGAIGLFVTQNPTTPTSIVIPNPISKYPAEITWAATYQDAYRIRIKDTTGTNIIWDSGIIPGPHKRALIYPPINAMSVQIALTVYNGGAATSEIGTGPIVLSAYVARQTASELGLEIKVFDGISGSFLYNLPNAYAPTFLDELGNIGAGSMTLLLTDSILVAHPEIINYQNIVQIYAEGVKVGFWVIKKHTPVVIAQDEGSAEAILVSGGGGRAWLDEAVLYAENAYFSQLADPPPKNRGFGFMSNLGFGSYASQMNPGYAAAFQQSQQSNASSPWNNYFPTGWPAVGTGAWWIWSQDTRTTAYPNAPAYFSYTFQVSAPNNDRQTYRIFAAGDNSIDLYLDGELLGSSTDWSKGVQTAPFKITDPTGVHTLTAVVTQAGYTGPAAGNPAGFLCVMTAEADPTSSVAQQAVFVSNSNWLCVGNPTVAPDWTTGDIIKTIYNEAVYRGVTSFNRFTLGFTEAVDSYGVAWPHDGTQWIFPIGDAYADIIDKMEQVNCDVWFDANQVLQAAPVRGIERATPILASDTYATVVAGDLPDRYWPMDDAAFTTLVTTFFGTVKQNAPTIGVEKTSATGTTAGGIVVTSRAWTAHTALDAPVSAMFGASVPYGVGDPTTGDVADFYNNVPMLSTEDLTGSAARGLTMSLGAAGNAYAWEWWTTDAPVSSTSPKTGDHVVISLQDASYNILGTIELLCHADTVNAHLDTWTLSYKPGVSGVQPSYTQVTKSAYAASNAFAHCIIQFTWVNNQGYMEFWLNNVKLISVQVATELHYYRSGWRWLSGFVPTGLGIVSGVRKVAQLAQYPHLLTITQIREHFQKGTNTLPNNPVLSFTKAKNVLTASSESEMQAKTMLVAANADGYTENNADAASYAAYGRIEGYYDGSKLDVSASQTVAKATIQNQLNAIDSATLDFFGGYTPWVDFFVGDWVLAPSNYNADTLVRRRVMSIALAEDTDTGRAVYSIELDTINQSDSTRFAKWLSRIASPGTLDGSVST